MTGIVITAAGEIRQKEFKTDPLDELQKIVGGWIEIVRPVNLPKGMVMIVNEEGRFLNLSQNFIGTALYSSECLTPILGDIVILGEGIVDGEPNLIGLSDIQVFAFLRMTGVDDA